ncbi:uncharacterized protein LOC125676134 [Ostrea edulis]|uniref:uncharacterized protein LOC125676134 n=1 Tax=Ostrea edulis TaxID=37623 RepID=UPI0024AFCB0C|nr:uncharacterized protein LOC125676134 [Ostrea edulis]XP_056015966.1 uncharacterized protein LOC125676134 [Ostrea edulis]
MISSILMLSTFLCVGTQVQSLSFDYLQDFVVEGGRPLTVKLNRKGDTRSIGFRFERECNHCTRLSATFPVNYTVRGDSFTLQATENVVVDELFLIKVVAFDKTKPNENLHVLRFTFVDNDDIRHRLAEGSLQSLSHTIKHPANLPLTTYSFSDVMDQSFNTQWNRQPTKVTFEVNEGGSKQIAIVPKDDHIVEGETTKYVLVIKKLISCEPVQHYYKHFVVSVRDNDVKGNWLPVGDWSKCEKIDQNSPFQDCRRMRSRSCSAPESVLGKHPVCDGSEMQTERCECPPRFG